MTPSRPRSPKGQGDLLHDEILEAAEALLLETGSEEAVSIRAVADRVGVTPPSIYRHFTDKSTLLFEVCDRQFARFHEYLDAKRSGHADPVEAVKAIGRAYVEFGLTYPEHYRIMFMGRSDLTPAEYADEHMLDTGAFGGLVDVVRACIEAGRLRPELDDPVSVAHSLWAAVHGVTSIAVAKPNVPGPPLDDRVEALLDMVLRGVAAGP